MLKVMNSEKKKFDLPIKAIRNKNGHHRLIGMYFVSQVYPKIGKPYVTAGVFKETLQDGMGVFLLTDSTRIGGDFDGECSNQVIPVRELTSSFNIFKSRADWLKAVQVRLRK